MGCFISSLHSLHNPVQWGHVQMGDQRCMGSDQAPGIIIIVIITVVTVDQGPTHTTSSQHTWKGNPKCMSAKWLQSCPTLCDPKDRSLQGSSFLGILQARILEWVAMPSLQGIKAASLRSPALACDSLLLMPPVKLRESHT